MKSTLSKLGRYELCKKIGITDNIKSIFIENEDAFNDRIELLNTTYNTQYLIELYLKELTKYTSEEEYIKELNKQKQKLLMDIKKRILICKDIIKLYTLNKSNEYVQNIDTCRIYDPEIQGKAFTRFYFDSPVYEGLKYFCSGIQTLPENMYDYMSEIIESDFLKYTDDINLDYLGNFDKSFNKILKQSRLDLGLSIFSFVSPKFISKNSVIKIDESEVIFSTAQNKTIESIDIMYNTIRNNGVLELNNINIELYSLKKLTINTDIKYKEIITEGNNANIHNIIDYTELEYIQYLRRLRKEQLSEYDKYFQYCGVEAKVRENIKIQWNS